jgi:hypothetical protein
MDKDYFKPVEFPALDKMKERAEAPETDDIPDIKEPLKVIKTEIQRMQDGTSEYRPGALQLPKGQCPATIALERLQERPGKKNLRTFLLAAQQDFGTRAAAFFFDEISKHYLEVHKLDVFK